MSHMTALDAPPPPPPLPPASVVQTPPVAPAPPKAPVSVLSVVAFIIVALTAVGYMTAKTLVPVFDDTSFEKQVNTIAIVFGILGFLSIVPIGAGIVLGHLGVRKSQYGKRGRAIGIAAIAGGYLLLALYFNRIIVSFIAVLTFPHGAGFLENNFFWA
jgi:hypothetical protein